MNKKCHFVTEEENLVMEQTKRLLDSYLRVSRRMSLQFRNYFGQLELTFPQMLVHKFEIGFVVLCWFLERTFESDRVLLLVMGVLVVLLELVLLMLLYVLEEVLGFMEEAVAGVVPEVVVLDI